MTTDAQIALAEALDRMWVQYLPKTRERIVILETAAADFAANHLSIEQHEAASSAAHKLAGVLGTFGITRGTVLARELEILYSRQNGPDPALAARLASTAAELRALVEARK
jgi:HPt (histidine-containing phosphotransfer) domain-containing protein